MVTRNTKLPFVVNLLNGRPHLVLEFNAGVLVLITDLDNQS